MTPEEKRNLAVERELRELALVVDKFEALVLDARDCARLCRESYERMLAVQAESEQIDNAIERLDSLAETRRNRRPDIFGLRDALENIATPLRVCDVPDRES